MRDRLIELLKQADEYASGVCIDYDEAQEVRADHLLAAGVVALPCKVGDVLYVLSQMRDKRILPFISTYEATYICVGNKKCMVCHSMDGFIKNFPQDDFGKTVFLTREEAEKALERREG